jgi:Lipopolysaccharide kinase (Kdo/WaaP) family
MTDSLWQRLMHGSRRLWRHDDWAVAAPSDWAESIMALDVTDRFHAKQGRSTGRWIVSRSTARVAVYLKRHYRLPWWRGLLATLWPAGAWSPAEQERRHLQWAEQEGLRVPRVLAAGEFIGPFGRLQSFLAVEELAGMLPLHEAVPLAAERLPAREFTSWKRGLIREMARMTRKLHGVSHFHKDLYLCHFYIPESFTRMTPSWTNQVFMIDLHRLGRHSLTRRVWQIKDLAELLYSSEVAGVTDVDRNYFWRCYLGQECGFVESVLLRWLVLAKYHRYRAHNNRRKARIMEAQQPIQQRSA